MFKYKLNNFYNVNDFTENYLNEYLKAIGIKNIINFLNPHKEDELSPFLLENMDKGIKLMREVVDKELKIVLIVD